jgi:3'-5' exoribonuclease
MSGCIRFKVHHAQMTIATLRAGQELDGVFACTRKDRLMSRAGTPYLAVELRDRTGAVQGRAFRDADVLAGRFDRGDLVRVAGRVERFRDELQVELRAIGRAPAGDADPAAFLPVAYRDLDELDGFLEHLAREVHDPGLGALLAALLADGELRGQWRRAPCTRGGHHAYLGGLLEHTVAVGTLALEACQLHPRLDCDLLVCAALVHDLGKTREFTYAAEIGLTDAGRLLGHVELGLALLREYAPRVPALSAERLLALAHCVLCHHGPDAAPGRRFGSAEALALHRLNALDAAVKGALEQGLNA